MSGPQKGAVAAGHKVTADAAAQMLEEGGNAFDAVLAGLAACCVCEPVFASLGGGGFLMARKAQSKQAELYDFFAATPAVKRPEEDLEFFAINAEFGPASQEFHIGTGSSAVPGLVPGLFAIHRDLCTLPMKRILEPAIQAAKDGIIVSAFQAYLLQVISTIVTADESTRSVFAPRGDLLIEGDTIQNHSLSDTFEALAADGEILFREGDIAKAICKECKTFGGHISADDLKDYQVIKRTPLSWLYRGADVALNPAPAASGPLIAFGLGLLEKTVPGGPAINASDLANIMSATNNLRATLGQDLSALETDVTIAKQLKDLEGLTAATRGTTHISVIDQDGNAASATVTNGEGNGRMVGNFGFMLNNMLGEEDLNPGGFHQWTPGERLSTMMAPTLVESASGAVTALGSGGSNRIRTAILQVIVNLLDKGMSLKEAVYAPRLHLEKCGTLSFEDLIADDQKDELVTAFPDAKPWHDRNFFFGGVHAVEQLKDGSFEACADPRRDGTAIIL